MNFLPRPGQIETTRTSEASELWTPVKISCVIALGADISIICLYFIALIVVLWADGFRSFWSWYSESFWGWPAMCALIVLAWPLSFGFVVAYRLGPEIINKNWPPTIKAIDPLLGMVSAWTNMGKRESALDRAYNRALQEDENDE